MIQGLAYNNKGLGSRLRLQCRLDLTLSDSNNKY